MEIEFVDYVAPCDISVSELVSMCVSDGGGWVSGGEAGGSGRGTRTRTCVLGSERERERERESACVGVCGCVSGAVRCALPPSITGVVDLASRNSSLD
jgi:hypothetical protein